VGFSPRSQNADWSVRTGLASHRLVYLACQHPWPITGATFVLVYKRQQKLPLPPRLLKFCDWSYPRAHKLS